MIKVKKEGTKYKEVFYMVLNMWFGFGDLRKDFISNLPQDYVINNRFNYYEVFLEYITDLNITFLYEKNVFSHSTKHSLIDKLINKEKFLEDFIEFNYTRINPSPLVYRVFFTGVRGLWKLKESYGIDVKTNFIIEESLSKARDKANDSLKIKRYIERFDGRFFYPEVLGIERKLVTNEMLATIKELGAIEIFKNVESLDEYFHYKKDYKYKLSVRNMNRPSICFFSSIEGNSLNEIKDKLKDEGLRSVVSGSYNYWDEFETEEKTRIKIDDLTEAYILFSENLSI